jgi:D-alanine transaminase
MESHSGISGVVWLNGELTDYSTARVSIDDRGFNFGDGVYEVIRVYDSKPFALERHLKRLERSAAGIEMSLPMGLEEIGALAKELTGKAGLDSAEIYIQLTRGAARRNHLLPTRAEPTFLVGVRQTRDVPSELLQTGCSVITRPDERWARCNLKTICLLPNVLAKEAAHRAGALEAVLIRDGVVTEGTSSNIFIWKSGRLVTPLADNRILPGITREIAIELAVRLGYEVVERDIKQDEMLSADEMFLTGTTVELMPVVKVDHHVIGNGRPGDVRGDLHAAFRDTVERNSRL